jgi:quinol-cytochrome oxidoreductase complex cytochrome b subunit
MNLFFLASVGCFLLAFMAIVVSMTPKRWRRRYQAVFETGRLRRINRNKRIDEAVAVISIRFSVLMLVCAMIFALLGIFSPKFTEFFQPPQLQPLFPGTIQGN